MWPTALINIILMNIEVGTRKKGVVEEKASDHNWPSTGLKTDSNLPGAY